MSRTPLPYGEKVIELFKNPQNLGKMEDATVFAQAGSPACGDMVAFYLKIDEDNQKIIKSSFESFGCASNIAAASQVTLLIKDLTLEEAWNINWKDVTDALGGLPRIKNHCGTLAVGALRRSIRKYFETIKKEQPNWLPDEYTKEEKHAMEEEELAKKLAKRYELV